MIKVIIHPGKQLFWQEFNSYYRNSVALDGYVVGGPQWDETTLNANFDHHSGVVREATMSTAMQVYFAIKGGYMDRVKDPTIFINDVDQDTCMAIWLLMNHKLFEGSASLPQINRIMSLNDKMDITGGAYPINLSEDVYFQHCWVFQPYTDLRKSGEIAKRNVEVYQSCLESVLGRLNKLLMGEAGKFEPKEQGVLLFQNKVLTVLDETTGGIEYRHLMFGQGMITNAYLSIVAKRDDGKFVYTLGKKSRYVDFDLKKAYADLNEREGCTPGDCWGGSDIVGGAPRVSGSGLSWDEVVDELFPIDKR